MKDLVRIEEKQLIIADEVIKKIKELETKKKLINEKEKEFKTKLEEIFSKNECNTSFESADKTLKITYTPEVSTLTFDTKRFEEEHHDLYVKYQKEGKRKGSVRITVREEDV